MNPSIRDALVDMLGKPIAESNALCIPTAMYGHPWVGPGVKAWQFISGEFRESHGGTRLEIRRHAGAYGAAKHRRRTLGAAVRETDVLLVAGGDALYLCHWMRQSGLAELLPSLQAVYVGMSAGSMVMAPNIGEILRWLDSARRQRRNAESGRFCDLSASGARDAARKHHGCRGAMGRRDARADVCD